MYDVNISGTMLTTLELQYIRLTFKYSSKLPTCSFRFKNGEIYGDKRKLKLYFLYVKILLLLALNVALLLSKFPSTLSTRYFPHIVMNGIEVMAPLGVSLFQLSACFYQDEILVFVKQTLAFNLKFGEWI